MKRKPKFLPLKKVRSKITQDIYYTSESLPTKKIDGILFVGIKKSETDKRIFFMNKEFIEKC
jgi:hypothetical protein